MDKLAKTGRKWRGLSASLFAVAALALCGTAFAATNYVDCVNGVDAAGRGGALTNAWKTLQYAVNSSRAGDTILVAPGEYKTDSDTVVNISKKLTLKSIAGKENTHIVGYDSVDLDAPPEGFIRCVNVGSNAGNSVVDGFTIRGASGNGEGIAMRVSGSDNTAFLIDSVVSNCVSSGNSVLIRTRLVRSLITENRVLDGCTAYNAAALNCIFLRNRAAQSFRYPRGSIVNCTLVANSGNTMRYPSSRTIYNSLFMYESPSAGNNSGVVLTNCVGTGSSGVYDPASANVWFAQPVQQIMSFVESDWRLVEGCRAQTAGDAQYLSDFTLPEEYEGERYKDYFGNTIPQDGTIAAGAVQTAVTPACGINLPASETYSIGGRSWNVGALTLHSYYDHWPKQIRVAVTSGTVPSFYSWRGKYVCPDRGDNSYMLSLAPGIDQSFSVIHSQKVLYVDKAAGDDGYDGLSETVGEADPETGVITAGPKRTIQGAVDATEASSKITAGQTAVINVAEGVYDEGERYWYGTNRVHVPALHFVRIVATGSPERTVIMGAADTSDESKGLGPAAVRCVGNEAGIGGLQGFTLTGGHTRAGSEDINDYLMCGGAFFAVNGQYPYVSDCIISNNVGKKGGTISGGSFFRCLITGNDHSRDQYDMIRKAVLSSCVVFDNKMGSNPADLGDGVSAYHCTVKATRSIFRTTTPGAGNIFNCIFFDSTNNSLPARMAGTLYDSVTDTSGVTGYVEGSAAFVDRDARDLRITSLSDAIGAGVNGTEEGVADTSMTNCWMYVSTDFEGNPITYTDGKPTAGAFQRALLAVEVKGSRVTPAAGNYVLEPNGSLTVTATSERGFIGFMVNGEMVAGRELSYTIASGGGTNAKGGVVIEPVYQFGTSFVVR